MKKKEEKTLLTIDVLSILSWIENKDGYISKTKLPIKIMWEIKADIAKLAEIRARYNDFESEINSRYMSDEFSYNDEEIDENGNRTQIRKVKNEYLDQFNSEKRELLSTENKIDVSVFDIEDFGDIEIGIHDLNMLGFFIASIDSNVTE